MNTLIVQLPRPLTLTWYGSRLEFCRDLVACAVGLADPFEAGLRYRRRLEEEKLSSAFSRCAVAIICVRPLTKAEAAWAELLTRVHGRDAVTPETMSYAGSQRAWGTLANNAYEKAVALPEELWRDVFEAGRARAVGPDESTLVFAQ